MKILLLEDDDEKARRIKSVLDSVGKELFLVEVKADVASARARLDEDLFDLLILDIRVPFREGEASDDKGGIHLLKELLEDEQHKRPRYVVGISGAEDIFQESSLIFRSHGWALLQYSPVLPEWADSLRYFVEHIIRSDKLQIHKEPKSPKADVVIITALENPEFSGVKTIFPELKGPRPLDSKTLIWEGEITVGSEKIRIVSSSCWQMGLTASALLVERLLSEFQPKIIAMTGICAGYRDVVSLGDIIVATQSWEWQGGKIVQGEDELRKLLPAPEPYRASQELVTALSIFKTDKRLINEILNRYCPSEMEQTWRLHFGPVVSGLSVIASQREMDDIRTQHRKILGLEMEAYSVYAASHFHPISPRCVVIKGVCDFGDEAKGDDFQRFSSIISATVLRAMLESDNVRALLSQRGLASH